MRDFQNEEGTFRCPEREIDITTQTEFKKVGNLYPCPHNQQRTKVRKTQSLTLADKSALDKAGRVQVRDSGDQEDPPCQSFPPSRGDEILDKLPWGLNRKNRFRAPAGLERAEVEKHTRPSHRG